jgi:hypothetical protein
MEPDWTKSISSRTVCNFFYAFYVVYMIIFVVSLITTISIFGCGKKLGLAGTLMGIQGLIITGVGATMMLFYYLICDRALLAKSG